MTGRITLFVILLCLFVQSEVFSQDSDTISAPRTGGSRTTVNEVVKDSARLAAEERPRIAVRKSAILPGLGQIYNKRWWKVPLVYGGFIGIGLVFEFNQRYYQIFLKEAQYRELNPGKSQNPLFAQYSREGIISIKDSYRRNRDLSILAGIGFYAIQLIDAYVDAKFFRFDISDDLSLKIEPLIQSGTIYNASVSSPGIGFKVKLAL